MLKPRDAICNLTPYHPPLAGREGLRMDFNENTAGCSPKVLERLRSLTAEDLTRYPERAPLERRIAEFLALDPSQVLLTNGVDEAIHLLCSAYLEPGAEAVVPVPTFAMYELSAQAAGATVVRVPAGGDFAFPADAILAALSPRTRLIAIANPNNPTGAIAATAELVRIAQAEPNAAVLVDEAYFDFYGQTALSEIQRLPNLFVSRTFSKAYGLAGLRLGALIGAAEQIAWLRTVTSPYNVNAAALACLPIALEEQTYVRNYVAQVRAGREELRAALTQAGVQSWPSEANFVLARFGNAREPFVAGMRRRGILVRDRHTDPGCAGCVRITLGTNEHNRLLLAALRETLAECGSRAAAAEQVPA